MRYAKIKGSGQGCNIRQASAEFGKGGMRMRIRDDLRLRRVDGKSFVVAIGEASKLFHSMTKLNDSAALIFTVLQDGGDASDAAEALVKEYGIDPLQAQEDAQRLIKAFSEAGFFV
jgi:hypothetical protein